jgi:hypothetical protein
MVIERLMATMFADSNQLNYEELALVEPYHRHLRSARMNTIIAAHVTMGLHDDTDGQFVDFFQEIAVLYSKLYCSKGVKPENREREMTRATANALFLFRLRKQARVLRRNHGNQKRAASSGRGVPSSIAADMQRVVTALELAGICSMANLATPRRAGAVRRALTSKCLDLVNRSGEWRAKFELEPVWMSASWSEQTNSIECHSFPIFESHSLDGTADTVSTFRGAELVAVGKTGLTNAALLSYEPGAAVFVYKKRTRGRPFGFMLFRSNNAALSNATYGCKLESLALAAVQPDNFEAWSFVGTYSFHISRLEVGRADSGGRITFTEVDLANCKTTEHIKASCANALELRVSVWGPSTLVDILERGVWAHPLDVRSRDYLHLHRDDFPLVLHVPDEIRIASRKSNMRGGGEVEEEKRGEKKGDAVDMQVEEKERPRTDWEPSDLKASAMRAALPHAIAHVTEQTARATPSIIRPSRAAAHQAGVPPQTIRQAISSRSREPEMLPKMSRIREKYIARSAIALAAKGKMGGESLVRYYGDGLGMETAIDADAVMGSDNADRVKTTPMRARRTIDSDKEKEWRLALNRVCRNLEQLTQEHARAESYCIDRVTGGGQSNLYRVSEQGAAEADKQRAQLRIVVQMGKLSTEKERLNKLLRSAWEDRTVDLSGSDGASTVVGASIDATSGGGNSQTIEEQLADLGLDVSGDDDDDDDVYSDDLDDDSDDLDGGADRFSDVSDNAGEGSAGEVELGFECAMALFAEH